MWLIFALLSLLFYAAADLFGKKCVNTGGSFVSIELTVTCSVISFAVSLFLFGFGLGESGMAPWQILHRNPLIMVNMLCFFAQWVLYLLSMKYVDLSIAEAVSGSTGVFYFIGMILLNVCIGKFPGFHDILHPLRLIPVIMVLGLIVLYPNVEQITKKRSIAVPAEAKENRRKYAVGLCLLLLSLAVDATDSLITALVIDERSVGITDYLMASYFATIIPILVFSVFIRLKSQKWVIPFRDTDRYANGFAVVTLPASVIYIMASYFDAVRTGILFLAYPIVPIIGAKMVLKEKHTQRQTLCIWMITIFSFVFCIADALL